MSFFSGLFKASDHPIGKSLNFGPYRVTILKLIAEGGYGYVYLARDANNERVLYALKKLLVRAEIAELAQQEIDIMRSTRHKNIVGLLETSTISIPNSSEKEVYILMEFCSGGTAAELTAQRALAEPEVLRIFSDICEAVGQLHIKEPPISHRDLKLENLLLHQESGSYKLCDFGSCRAGPLRVSSKAEMLAAEEEIQKFTTPAYRAPEMVDLYSGSPINEKVDIWALGCVLYKLCFRVTPFDDGESPLQILNVQYTVPSNNFSPGVIQLIAKCLRADPTLRPDIWSVFKKVCKLRQAPNVMERPRSRPKAPKPQVPAVNVDLRSSPGIPASVMQQPAMASVAKQTNYKHRRGKSNAEEAMAQPFPFPAAAAAGAGAGLAHPQPIQAQSVQSLVPPSHSPTLSPVSVSMPDPIPDLTASSTLPVTAQALGPLVTQTWTEGGAARVFDSISKRPIAGDAIVCLKALICLHMVFLEGHPQTIQDGIKNITLFNNLHTYWRNQKDSNPYAAAAICQYCKTLVKKLQFHQVHPEFEGNYSLDRYFQMADARGVILPAGDGHPMSKDTVVQMLDVFANVVSFFALLGDLNMLATSPMNSWVLSSALPLVQESYDIFLNVSFLTWKLMFVEQPQVFTQMQSNYGGVYNNVQALWATLSKVPTMPQIVTLPPLPPAVPAFNRTQVAPFQPPRSAQARAAVIAVPPPMSQPVSAPMAVPTFNPFAGSSPNDFGKPSPPLGPPTEGMNQLSLSDGAHRRTASSSAAAPIVVHLPGMRNNPSPQPQSQPPTSSPARQARPALAPPSSPQPPPPQRAQSSSTFNITKESLQAPSGQPTLMPPPEPKMHASGHRRSQSTVDKR